MRHDWRSDAKPTLTPGRLAELLEELSVVGLCDRCKSKSLEPLCPSCLDMVQREADAKEATNE